MRVERNRAWAWGDVGWVAGLGLAVLVGFSAGAKDKVPEWVEGGAAAVSAKYPSAQYLVGVGRAAGTGSETKDRAAADNEARREIASQIKVQVESTLTSRVEEQQTYVKTKRTSKSRTLGTQQVVSDIMSKVSMELEGIKIAETYYQKKGKQYFALGVMERSLAADSLRKFIASRRDAASGFYREGNSALKSHDAPRALGSYQKAKDELQQIEGKEAMVAVILGRPAPVDPNALTLWQIEASIAQALDSIKFIVQVFEVNPSLARSALVQSQIISGLRQKGYNVMDNASAFAGTSYDNLRDASVEELSALPRLSGNYLILGQAVARQSSQVTMGSSTVTFFLTSADLKIVNLNTGKFLLDEAFDWGNETKCGKPALEKAASCSLERAGTFLAQKVSEKVEEIFKSLE